MAPKIVLIIYFIFVIVLLRIEGKHNPNASLSLWVPTLYFLICASKPVGAWLSVMGSETPSSIAAGSPADRAVLITLFILSLVILLHRKLSFRKVFKANPWLFVLYLYMGISILWSGFPLISLRRWLKISMGLITLLVVLTEQAPFQAFESILRRTTYILIPLSLVLIKYFSYLGRQYNRWTGELMWTGVCGQKNGLGALCAVSIYFLGWFYIWHRKGRHGVKNPLALADTTVLIISAYLLFGNSSSYSATSIFTLIVGVLLLIGLRWKDALAVWMTRKLKTVTVAGILIYLLMHSTLLPVITSSLGRDTSLTGRKDIWAAMFSIASKHPFIGAGYGNLAVEQQLWNKQKVLQSHNGYIGVYIYLGIAGLLIFVLFIFSFCHNIQRGKDELIDRHIFGMCFLFMLLVYNYTESAFLAPSLMWTLTLFLSLIFSTNPPYLWDTPYQG